MDATSPDRAFEHAWMRLVVLVLALVGTGRAQSPVAATDVHRLLRLLAGVSSEYHEAFDDRGELTRPVEIEEVRLLLAEVDDLTRPMVATDDFTPATLIRLLATLVDAHAPPAIIDGYAQIFRRQVIQTTGVRDDVVPPERPSLARGREIFQQNCTGCHGAGGAGDGADATRLGLTPANFTDRTFMRGETPQDAFNVISLGRRKSGMAAWGDALSVQQIWDAVSYVWSLGRTSEAVTHGQRIYATRCAGCHGSVGDPMDAAVDDARRPFGVLSSLLESAVRSDAEFLAAVARGIPNRAMPAFAGELDEGEIADVVAFTRTLSLEGAPGATSRPPEPDRAAAMAEVGRMLERALDAHRRGDAAANAFATTAYLRFEPLERPLAEISDARMQALELAFGTFRLALRDPAAGDPQILGRALEADLRAAAELFRSPDHPNRFFLRSARPALLVGALMAVAICLVYGLALWRSGRSDPA